MGEKILDGHDASLYESGQASAGGFEIARRLHFPKLSAINRPVQTAWLANGHARAVFYCIERIAKCPR